MKKVRIFISSPKDVIHERDIVRKVLEQIREEFALCEIDVESFFWEDEVYEATSGYQDQILSMLEVDIIICIFWSRLGTQVVMKTVDSEGKTVEKLFESGTAYEFESAMDLYQASGKPWIYVYRKDQEPGFHSTTQQELERLQEFFSKWFGDERQGYHGSLHHFYDTDAFEGLMQRHLRRIVVDYFRNMRTEIQDDNTGPYRGLERFDREHAANFFGREELIESIIKKLWAQEDAQCHSVFLVGGSGCGKSSLVLAGILPQLVREQAHRRGYEFYSQVIRPGEALGKEPTAYLCDRVVGAFQELVHDREIFEQARQASRSGDTDEICRVVRGLVEASSQTVRSRSGISHRIGCKLIIIIDQLEELFTHGYRTDEQQCFTQLLYSLSGLKHVWVICTLRSDFYANCLQDENLIRLKRDGTIDIGMPSISEYAKIIRLPAARSGLRFEKNASGLGLDDQLLLDLQSQTGALPLLEYLLEQLYLNRSSDQYGNQLLTFDAYRQTGGMEGAISKVGEKLYGSFSEEEKREFVPIVTSMVTFENGHQDMPTSRYCTSLELRLESNETRKVVLERLIKSRLLTAEEYAQMTIVRFSHESLLRHWERINTIISDQRDRIALRDQLYLQAKTWRENGELNDFLIPHGELLERARTFLHNGRNTVAISDELNRYIMASVKADRSKGGLSRLAAAAAIMLLTGAFLWAWYLWADRLDTDYEAQKVNERTDEIKQMYDRLRDEMLSQTMKSSGGIVFSGDKRFAIVREASSLVCYTMDGYQEMWRMDDIEPSTVFADFFPGTSTVVHVTDNGWIDFINATDGTKTVESILFDDKVESVSLSKEGKCLSVSGGHQVCVYRGEDGKQLLRIQFEDYLPQMVEAIDSKTPFYYPLEEVCRNVRDMAAMYSALRDDGKELAVVFEFDVTGAGSFSVVSCFNIPDGALTFRDTSVPGTTGVTFSPDSGEIMIKNREGLVVYFN